jgi:hypothetical protein
VRDLFSLELEFVPSQQPREPLEGLLAFLREHGWDARLARSPHWGDDGPAEALIEWVSSGTRVTVARELAATTATWFRRHPAERNRLQPDAALRVMSRRSGRLLAERRIEHMRFRDANRSA